MQINIESKDVFGFVVVAKGRYFFSIFEFNHERKCEGK
jgi:hypothetical protein